MVFTKLKEWWCPELVCWRLGRHKYILKKTKYAKSGDRCVLQIFNKVYKQCKRCGHRHKGFYQEESGTRYHSVTMSEYNWDLLNEKGEIRW